MQAILSPEQVTVADVVRKRQTQLLDEKFALDSEVLQLRDRLREVEMRMAEIHLEYQILEDTGNRRATYTPDVLTMAYSGRKPQNDKLHFEDTLKRIFELAGRPMGMTEIIGRLKEFGFQWSKYQTAYAYIKQCDVIESTGARGFYQIRQVKW